MASGEDRISGLPDELLHAILVRVRSARDAVRTSVLSRRWRHILVHPLPELVFEEKFFYMPPPPPAPPPPPPPRLESFLYNVDAALDACDAAVIKGLRIVWMWCVPLFIAVAPPIPTGRVEPWLRFASERVVDVLHLEMSPLEVDGEERVLELPLCEWVKRIHLGFGTNWRIRPPSAGLFRALVHLTIRDGRMDGSELTALVCTQCPCLKDLDLLLSLVDDFNISIRSDSLQSLRFRVEETQWLEIVAPRLEKLFIPKLAAIGEAQITAPKLEELVWPEYDPSCHQFDDVGRRLRVLQPDQNGSLMQQFDEVDELKLSISIPQELAGYESFLNETNRLPKCKILSIFLWRDLHALVPGILHLLRSCNSTRKIYLIVASVHELEHPCLPTCPCLLEESYRIDDIPLNSLEEVEITSYRSSHKVLEFVEQLSRCNTSSLKKVVIKYMFESIPPTKEVREKIRSMCQPNIEVEFLDQEWVLLD